MTGPQPDDQESPTPTSDDPAFVAPDDVERAKVRWPKVAPGEFEDLLDAPEGEPGT